MAYLLKNVKNHVLASKQEYCTWDYGTREPDYADHHGIDLINNAGGSCDVIAIADGEVVYVQDGVPGHDEKVYTAGNFVRIRHENGMYSRYLHMVNGSIKVKIGQKVKAGTVLGHEGETGYSFGVHLHFDVNDGKNYVDPLPYLLGEKSLGSNATNNETIEPTTNVTLHKGDKVTLKNAPLYGASTSKNKANTISGTYYVYCDGIINNRVRITTSKNNTVCTGWVNVADCNVSSTTTATKKLAIGDNVTVKAGAKFSDGTVPFDFVYDTTFCVKNISRDGKEALIGLDGKSTGWMYITDLEIV